MKKPRLDSDTDGMRLHAQQLAATQFQDHKININIINSQLKSKRKNNLTLKLMVCTYKMRLYYDRSTFTCLIISSFSQMNSLNQ